MALSIKDAETERLARQLARQAGESITTATRKALEERLARLAGSSRKDDLLEDLAAIRRRWSAIPVRDDRSPDDIVGYDDAGAPR